MAGVLVTRDAGAYRFVCNSVDFTGVPLPDICGTCTEDLAARWPDARLRLTRFDSGLPAELAPEDWEAIVEAGGARWNEVDECAFRFDFGPPAPGATPTFAAADDTHHLFWVEGEPADWQALTFTNPDTTIGLTAVRYTCPSGGEGRSIFDADVVLNNTSQPWECPGPECWSAEHAITHELGHALGLGHACAQCTTLLMVTAADSTFQPTELFDDDRAGCRALYPPQPDAPPEVGPDLASDAAPESATDAGDDVADGAEPATPEDCHCGGADRRTPDPLVAAALLWLLAAAVRRRHMG